MIEDVRAVDARGEDYVEFHAAGTRASGLFRCSACGYGIAVRSVLPACPMCLGTSWERDERPGSRRA
jgi:hypothetical protein